MAEWLNGLVISHLGQAIAVEINGRVVRCQTRRKLETLAAGDRVNVQLVEGDEGRVEELLPRESLLQRPSRNKRIRPVAANIDQVCVVFATEPECDFLLIDQYLAICENKKFQAILILNKADLAISRHITDQLPIYKQLGYSLFQVSTREKNGLEGLKAQLKQQTSVFSGQSGVGKSSLTNVLIPDKDLKTNSVSELTGHGRHTTTAATLYHLPDGGKLIDSPGVAIFGLADLTEQELAWGFREFQGYINHCRFHDCMHQGDKGCAVESAVESGKISVLRYQRFLKLREKLAKN